MKRDKASVHRSFASSMGWCLVFFCGKQRGFGGKGELNRGDTFLEEVIEFD